MSDSEAKEKLEREILDKTIEVFDQFKKISRLNIRLKNLIGVIIIEMENLKIDNVIIEKYKSKLKEAYNEQ
jgi:hypothetical protein